jgi:predicted RNA binding protein YcfA (HicA-like mRNA interferase family)
LPKKPVLTAKQAEKMVLKDGYKLIRTKGSHRIYIKGGQRIVIPFHSGKSLYPKIVKQILLAVS